MKKYLCFLCFLNLLLSVTYSQSFQEYKWDIGFNCNLAKSIRFSGASSYDTIPYDTLGYDIKEGHAINTKSFGIDLQRKLKYNFSIKTGLFINAYGIESTKIRVYKDTFHLYGWGDEYQKSYCYLSFPLYLSYNYLQGRKMRSSITSGFELNYLKWSRSRSNSWMDAPNYHESYDPKFYIRSIDKYAFSKNGIHRFNFSYFLSTSIDFKFKNCGYFRVEPFICFQMRPLSGKSEDQFYRYGLNLSLNFFLQPSKKKLARNQK